VSIRKRTWRTIAAEKAAEAESAIKVAADAKMVAAKAASDSADATRQLRKAEAVLASAERRLKAAHRSLEEARSERATERAEREKANALELVAESERRLDAVKGEVEPKIKAAEATRAEADAATAAKVTAQEAAKLAETKLAPVSVLISRKTQRLYVRQAFQPMFEAPVTVRDANQPIGTTIFTALRSLNDDADLRWGVLAMYKPERSPSRGKRADERAVTNGEAAKAALERISIPIEVLQRINEVASPGASLIISDEAMHHRETGKGTDFIVVMSGEPQGGLTIRPRSSNRDRERSYRHRRSVRSSGGIIE